MLTPRQIRQDNLRNSGAFKYEVFRDPSHPTLKFQVGYMVFPKNEKPYVKVKSMHRTEVEAEEACKRYNKPDYLPSGSGYAWK